jgi:hypothetical protein
MRWWIAAMWIASACNGGGPDPEAPDASDATMIDAPAIDAALIDAPEIDAPEIDAPEIDAPVIDAPVIDAPAIDAPAVDAPAIDAPAIDAPAIDAPVIDAPVIDAPVIDAPAIDAPAIDASTIDAPAIDAPFDPVGWPAAVDIAPVAYRSGMPSCIDFGQDHLGWGTRYSATFAQTAIVFLDLVQVALWDPGIPPICTVAVTHDGHLLYGFPSGDPLVHERPGNDANLAGPGQSIRVLDVVAVDPAGGAVVQIVPEFPPEPARLVRLTDDMQRDLTFGTSGMVAAPNPIGMRRVQGGAAPYVTMLVGTNLVRMDLRTGAPIVAFGGAGVVPLGFPTAELVAMAPLPDGRLGLVRRHPGGFDLTITRLDASGAATTQAITFTRAVVTVGADTAGRVTFSMAGPDGVVLLTRFDAATNTIDPSFGTAGRLTVRVGNPPCGPSTPSPGVFAGVLGRGTLIFRAERGCPGGGPINPTTIPYTAYVWYDAG